MCKGKSPVNIYTCFRCLFLFQAVMAGKIDQTKLLPTVIKHSNLNVPETLENLMMDLKCQAAKEINTEDIPGFCHKLSVVSELINWAREPAYDTGLTGQKQNAKNNQQLQNTVRSLVDEVCLPLLNFIRPSVDSRSDVLVFMGKVGLTLAECASFYPHCLTKILQQIELHLAQYLKEKPTACDLQKDMSLVDIHTILDVLRQVLNKTFRKKDLVAVEDNMDVYRRLFSMIVASVDNISADLTGTKCIPVLVSLMKLDIENTADNLITIWSTVEDFYQQDEMRKVFLLLCGFANYFFPTTGEEITVDIRGKNLFWQILQQGLYSKDSVNRKRSLYLLKRIVDICESFQADLNTDGKCTVFWWDKSYMAQLSKTWEDFLLLSEVFEEKQVTFSFCVKKHNGEF